MTLLLIGHDANRAGAQLVLLRLMEQLHANGIRLYLLLGEGGPLLPDYEKLGTVTIWPQPEPYVAGPTADKVLGKLGLWEQQAHKQQMAREKALYAALHLDSVDLVLVNTVTSGRYFRQLPLRPALPVLVFVHELALSVSLYTQPDDLRYLLDRATRLLAVSEATAHYYETTWQVPPDRITRFTLIDLPAIEQSLAAARQQTGALAGLAGLPADAVVVGGCGNAEWRKGTDLFVTVAAMLTNRLRETELPPVYFVWVGLPPGPLHNDLTLDVAKAGLTDRVRFIAPTPDVLRYMARFDVFLLCSREDPYPLVMLEAGLSARPVVCFEGAGGAAELVETDGGAVVPYLDLGATVQALQPLVASADLRQQQGQTLQRKIRQRHDLKQSTDQLLLLLTELVSSATPA